MPALDWITVKGFRSLKSIERLALGNINIIIGSNGSGKSNFIGVFSLLNSIRDGNLKEYVGRNGGANSILHFGSKITGLLSVHVSFKDEVNQYKIEMEADEKDDLIPTDEKIFYWDKIKYPAPWSDRLVARGFEAGISKPQSGPVAMYVREHLRRWRVYHFHDTSRTSPMKQTADLGDNRFLRPDGSNLAPFLYMLREKHENEYGLIINVVRQVAPYFIDFMLEPLVLNEDKIRLEWKHEGTDSYFSAASLSDGTLRFIALATLLLQPSAFRPSVILIDEPELGLHPYALTMLASLIRQCAIDTQVIISTQSALFLDNFDPHEVLVADRVNNATQLNRLSEDMLGDWLDDYSLGQLWEKAEFGGRPGSGRERLA